jgi:hypothetical protein
MHLTKYGQPRCATDNCNEPPLAPTPLCFKCTRGAPVAAFVESDDPTSVMVPTAPVSTEPVSVTAVDEAAQLRKVAVSRVRTRPVKATVVEQPRTPTTAKTVTPRTPTIKAEPAKAALRAEDESDADLKTMTRAELEAILAAPAASETEKRRKGRARSRLWHLKQKGQ